MNLSNRFKEMEVYISDLQNEICTKLESYGIKKFSEDIWEREEGGGGKTRVIQNGNIFEKGGVNISSVNGELSDLAAHQLNTTKQQFGACGISLVIHPFSPMIPTIHMNVRYFELEEGKSWFGGGIDLTPYYPFANDFKYFHQTLKDACESAIKNSYDKFKRECDEYFTIKHRNEMRGIGGIFFDYLDGSDPDHSKLVKFVGDAFIKCYTPIIEKRKNEKFSEQDKEFQLFRRGRYVEFNLIYDRGTIFGLKTNGNIESILMSMPPVVKFPYNNKPQIGTHQVEMNKYYKPKNWV